MKCDLYLKCCLYFQINFGDVSFKVTLTANKSYNELILSRVKFEKGEFSNSAVLENHLAMDLVTITANGGDRHASLLVTSIIRGG